MRWLGRAIDDGNVTLERAHGQISVASAARIWLRDNYAVLPNDARPHAADLDAFANLFASYLVVSFDLTRPRRVAKKTHCGCYCPLCSIFVERCFAFLLEREPKESILRRFDVSVIARYFPEFERVIAL